MDLLPDLKKDVANLFDTSESSESIQTIDEILKNSNKIYKKSSLINNITIFNSDGDDGDIKEQNIEELIINDQNINEPENINELIIKESNLIKETEFINFLNKFIIINNKFVPIEYNNIYRHYGTKKDSKIFLDEWEILHIFNNSSVEEALKNLKILKIRKIGNDLNELQLNNNIESNFIKFSKSHEKVFYKSYFSLKEKYNIFDEKIFIRTKDFVRNEVIGIKIKFIDFKKPEFINQEDTVYVILNETDYVSFLVESIQPNLEITDKLIKEEE